MDANALQKQEFAAKVLALQTLTQYPEWQVFSDAMGAEEHDKMEMMLRASPEEFSVLKGYINGLRFAHHIPQKYQDYLKNLPK